MSARETLYTVCRIWNGWVVMTHRVLTDDREIYCGTWEEVERICKGEAFPYHNKSEPRGPKDWTLP